MCLSRFFETEYGLLCPGAKALDAFRWTGVNLTADICQSVTTMKRPDTLINVAKASEDARTHGLAMAGFLDNFYTLPDRRQAMIDPEPPLTGKAEMDAYLAAVAEHLARRWDLTIPAWTNDPARFLKKPKFASSIEALKPLLLAQSPLAFRKRMIFVEHEPLRRARMPRS